MHAITATFVANLTCFRECVMSHEDNDICKLKCKFRSHCLYFKDGRMTDCSDFRF